MKILLVHNQYQQVGGEQVVVEAQIRLLRENGHQVILYQRDNVEIKDYTLIQKIVFIFNTVYSQKTVREIRDIIRTQNPDIIHVHNVFPLISPSIYWTVYKLGVPMIQTIHNFRFLCPNGLFYTHGQICERCKMGNTLHTIRWRCYKNSWFLSVLYAFTIGIHRLLGTFKKVSGFITLNSFTTQQLIESKIVSENGIRIIPNFILPPYPDLDSKKCENTIVYLGRLSEEKGVHVLLESLRYLPQVKLHIIGTGSREVELKKQAMKFGDQVIFEGFLGGERKYASLKQAQMMIIPSLWYEQFPINILESMAAATPVIASNSGGLPSLIQDEKNGLLFQPGNAEDLARKIQILLDDPELALEMGFHGRRMVENQFSAASHLEKLICYYKEVLSRISSQTE